MKVTLEVDCTPEEARRFLGLPDVVLLQQAIMERSEVMIYLCYNPDLLLAGTAVAAS